MLFQIHSISWFVRKNKTRHKINVVLRPGKGKEKKREKKKEKRKKKKEKRRGNVPTAQESIKKRKKEKNEKRKERNCPCVSARTFLSIKQPYFLPLVFSPFWGEKFLVGPGRKHPSPPFIFLSPHPTKHTPKNFFFPFSFQNFPSNLFHLQTNTPLILQ